MSEQEVPVSEKEYDFRTEPIAAMDAGTVDMHLANIASPSHPYRNGRDPRHAAATQYVTALYERQVALRPPPPERDPVLAQRDDEARQACEKIRREMLQNGFADFQLPAELHPRQAELLRRDLQIRKGQLQEAVPSLRIDLQKLGMLDAGMRKGLEFLEEVAMMARNILDPATGETELDRSPLRTMAIEAAADMQRQIGERISGRYKEIKAKVAAEMAADRAAGVRYYR